ncbi:MAG: PEGA domain-containing protein [Polyangiaceae bacterium]
MGASSLHTCCGVAPDPADIPTASVSASAPISATAPDPASAASTASSTTSPTQAASAKDPPPVPTSTLPRECRANVRSYPDGATVLWNGEKIGATPLYESPVPCGPAKVTFEMRGFESGERSAGPVIGKPAGVFMRLLPLRVPVDVTSTPAGAQILVDGRSMGRTPATITMIGGRESTLVVRLPGYSLWKKKLNPEPPKVDIHADLEKR